MIHKSFPVSGFTSECYFRHHGSYGKKQKAIQHGKELKKEQSINYYRVVPENKRYSLYVY